MMSGPSSARGSVLLLKFSLWSNRIVHVADTATLLRATNAMPLLLSLIISTDSLPTLIVEYGRHAIDDFQPCVTKRPPKVHASPFPFASSQECIQFGQQFFCQRSNTNSNSLFRSLVWRLFLIHGLCWNCPSKELAQTSI